MSLAVAPSALASQGVRAAEQPARVGHPQLRRSERRSTANPMLQCKVGLPPLSTVASCRASAGSGSIRQAVSPTKRILRLKTESLGGIPVCCSPSLSVSPSRVRRRPVRVLDEASSSEPAAASPAAKDRNAKKIWLSDVVPSRQRPYFLNRAWTSKDITYGSYLLLMHVLCLAAPFTFSWNAFGVFGVLYFVTGCLGITLSFHRNLSHKSFKLPKWLEYTFAYCGVQAVQGDPIEWVSSHRYHHQFCDTDMDPHTPKEGFWHSHMGWVLDDTTTEARVGARANVGDMARDPFYKFIQKTYIWHPIAMGGALFALGGVPYVIWGMAVRSVWVYHITWAVNSASHVWGYQSWNTGDLSRNNWWVALLAFGEGWHNNHHAFEYSARHGLEWWQLDPTWYIVKMLEAVGLATKVKLPSREHKQKLSFPAVSTAP